MAEVTLAWSDVVQFPEPAAPGAPIGPQLYVPSASANDAVQRAALIVRTIQMLEFEHDAFDAIALTSGPADDVGRDVCDTIATQLRRSTITGATDLRSDGSMLVCGHDSGHISPVPRRGIVHVVESADGARADGERAEADKRSEKRDQRTVVLASLAVFMIALEMTIIAVALPEMRKSLGSPSAGAMSWVFSSYNISVAAILVMGGWLAERFGRKLIFMVGLVVFAAGSVVSGTATVLPFLLAGRVVQALGGAMLIPSSLALIMHRITEPDRRLAAIGTWGAMAGLAAAIGPTAGAALVAQVGWRSLFLINVPIALVALGLGSLMLTESRGAKVGTRLDLLGAGLGAGGVGLLVYGIVESERFGITGAPVIGGVIGGIGLLALFGLRNHHHEHPLFPSELLAIPSYRVGVTALGLFSAGFIGWLVLIPTLAIQTWDYSVEQAGLAMAIAPTVLAVSARPAGKLAVPFGLRKTIIGGCVLTVIALVLWVATTTARPSMVIFAVGAVLFGLGLGLGLPMSTAAAMRDVGPSQFAMASAGATTVRQVAFAMGISISVAIVTAGDESLTAFKVSWVVCGGFMIASGAAVALAYPDKPDPEVIDVRDSALASPASAVATTHSSHPR